MKSNAIRVLVEYDVIKLSKCVVYTSDHKKSSTEQPTTRWPDVKKTQVDATTMQDKTSEAYRWALLSSVMWTVWKAICKHLKFITSSIRDQTSNCNLNI